MFGHGEGWFTALPDCEAGLAVASRLGSGAAVKILRYESGCPFLIGEWGECLTLTNSHGLCLVLIGAWLGDDAELRRRISGIRNVDDIGPVLDSLAGDFHAVATSGGRIRVQGTASGMRRVFHATAEGLTVASNRSDILARLTDASLDEELVAVRLLDSVPHPLGDLPLWQGIHAVRPGSYLLFSADASSCVPWWNPPEPKLDLAEGAHVLRTELERAVRVRTDTGAVISSDLSGGLDSTAICSLAATFGAAPVALTMPSRDPGDEDVHWAKIAGAELELAEHIELSLDDVPLFYSGLLDVTGPVDEPLPTILDQPRQLAGHQLLLERGCELHLTGMGGDHVLWGHPAHVRDLISTNPRSIFRSIRGYRAQNRWTLRETLSALTDRRPYGQWLSDSADELTAPRPSPHSTDVFAWDIPSRLPSWASPDAVRTVRKRIKQVAHTVTPRGASRAMHSELNVLHHGTRATRLLHQVAEHGGLPLSSPFFDDRVIEACWSVRPEVRTTPWEFKPLLKDAMRERMPRALLSRDTKGEASADAANGLRENRGRLVELWQNSRLAELGLVDKNCLIETTLRPSSPELRYGGLDATLACEVWLRTI
ncbi:asparagine synthase-related protein [Streptomyces sioyaensis]|uniref:asparagine synthase-related protein n=1 Tax=Streptomyces sioyaensis TaxID=67364 RepID=UPI00365AF5DA